MEAENKASGISVILPVYNGGKYLALSVNGVLDQLGANFELLVVDDCSTDGSREWLQSIRHDHLSVFYNSKNEGLFFNLNFLASRARFGLIKLWAQDDVMLPGCLEGFINFHQRNSGLGYSYCMRDIVDENGVARTSDHVDNTPEIISSQLHADLSYMTGSLPGNIANVCMVREAFEQCGKFNGKMKISADFDMWVRLGLNYPTGFLKQKLVQIRDHGEQLSRSEHSYVLHVEEDLRVFTMLDKSVNEEVRTRGRKMLRSRKLLFYYTLMLKALAKGRISFFLRYFRALFSYDNIITLGLLYLRRVFRMKFKSAKAIRV